jgi:hypothetical protein
MPRCRRGFPPKGETGKARKGHWIPSRGARIPVVTSSSRSQRPRVASVSVRGSCPDMFPILLRLATPWLGPHMPVRSMRGQKSACLERVGSRSTRPVAESEVPVSSRLPWRATSDRSFRPQAASLVPPATYSR